MATINLLSKSGYSDLQNYLIVGHTLPQNPALEVKLTIIAGLQPSPSLDIYPTGQEIVSDLRVTSGPCFH